MNIPEKLLYSKDHLWIAPETSDTVRIGLTDFAQDQFGEVVFLEIDKAGEPLSKDDIFGTVEAVKTVSDLFMPFDGEIVEVNPDLKEQPGAVNTDPYGKGWLAVVRIANPRQMDRLLPAAAYKELIG